MKNRRLSLWFFVNSSLILQISKASAADKTPPRWKMDGFDPRFEQRLFTCPPFSAIVIVSVPQQHLNIVCDVKSLFEI